jgi:hypothetical protein
VRQLGPWKNGLGLVRVGTIGSRGQGSLLSGWHERGEGPPFVPRLQAFIYHEYGTVWIVFVIARRPEAGLGTRDGFEICR